MSLTTLVNRVTYTGAGIAGPFAVPFKFNVNGDIKVIRTLKATGIGVVLAEGADYTLTGAGVAGGGSVTLTAAIDATYGLTIYRDPQQDQQTQFPPNDKFPAAANETALDKLTMLIQRAYDFLNRSIRFADSDVSGASTTLPTPVAGSVLGWAADGLSIVNYISAGVVAVSAYGLTLLNAANAAAARVILGISAVADAVVTAATVPLMRIALGFSAIAAKGDLFVGSAANTIATQTVGTDNQAVLADATTATGLRYVTLGAGSVRQSVQQGVQDANGYANMLTTGAGLRPGLSATAKACIIAFAAGFGQAGAADLVSTISADVADPLGADLKLSNTAYVRADYASPITVTWGAAYIPPQYGYAFDRTQNSLLHFEQAAGAPLCDFGNTYALSGATLTTTKPPYGTRCLDISGGGTGAANVKNAFSTDITSFGGDSFEVSCVFWHDVAPATPNTHYVFSGVNATQWGLEFGWFNNAGTNRFVLNVSSDGASRNVANLSVGTAVPVVGHWYRYRYQFDALAGKHRLFISDGGTGATPVWTPETKDIEVSSTARVCAITRVTWGATWTGAAFTNGASGFLDEAQITRWATNTSIETPSGYPKAVTDTNYGVNFFSIPDMKMYEVTAASGAAGVNPTLTARNRCFIGEADTSGAAVTAVRSYALRGQYISALGAVTAGTNTTATYSHNIGVPGAVAKLLVKNVTTQSGYTPGAIVEPETQTSATPTFDGLKFNTGGRNTMTVHTGANANLIILDYVAGGMTGITAASWSQFATAQRPF